MTIFPTKERANEQQGEDGALGWESLKKGPNRERNRTTKGVIGNFTPSKALFFLEVQ